MEPHSRFCIFKLQDQHHHRSGAVDGVEGSQPRRQPHQESDRSPKPWLCRGAQPEVWLETQSPKNQLKNVQEEQDKDDGGLAVGAQPAEAVHGQQFIIMIIIFITMMITMMITMIIEGTCQTMRSKGWLPSSSLKASSGCKPCRWRGTRCAGIGFK